MHTHLEVERQGRVIKLALSFDGFPDREQDWNVSKVSKNIYWNFCVWYVKNIYSLDTVLKLGLDVSLISAIIKLVAYLSSSGG